GGGGAVVGWGGGPLPPGLFFEPVELGDAARVHRVEPAPEYRFDERVLGAEVVVHGREVGLRLGSGQAHRGALEAVLHEQFLGGVENAGAGFVRGLDGAQGHGAVSTIQTNV